jgi:acid stress-induced BolA-like protein IbaG/YrbA
MREYRYPSARPAHGHALGELMDTDIHALTITALTPGEYHRE